MKRYIDTYVLLAVASLAQAQAPQPGQPLRLGTESGFGIFQQKCMICHGKANAPEKAPDDKNRIWNAAGTTAIPGVVFVPGGDGKLHALASKDGRSLWEYDSNR